MTTKTVAKPFLKWAGGKTQLLNSLVSRLPASIKSTGVIHSYIEPFVGGGALFFHLRANFCIEKSLLMDANRDLILAYKTIQQKPHELIVSLKEIEEEYLTLDDDKREEFYYRIRDLYNDEMHTFDYFGDDQRWVTRTTQLVFLNKTCYNGLFRLNKQGYFNVPHGSYKNPTICDATNIFAVNKALEGVDIVYGDFEDSRPYVCSDSLVYFDPPYRPLSRTASFTSYNQDDFDDDDQIRLGRYFRQLDSIGAHLLLSNSDPKASDQEDNFFDILYSEYTIERVSARRNINSNGKGRGAITELIIRNY